VQLPGLREDKGVQGGLRLHWLLSLLGLLCLWLLLLLLLLLMLLLLLVGEVSLGVDGLGVHALLGVQLLLLLALVHLLLQGVGLQQSHEVVQLKGGASGGSIGH